MRCNGDTASVRPALRIGAALVLLILLAPAPSAVPAAAPSSSSLTVTYLGGVNIGMILQTPSGKTYVIDPGLKQDAYNMINFLKSKGISTLDGLVITHPHGDHFEAVELPDTTQDIFGQFTVNTLYHNNCQKIAHDSNAGHTDDGGNGYHGD
ncbi:MAG: MBL fold metallo-hydrolase, partial [Planctomycetota bacterium]